MYWSLRRCYRLAGVAVIDRRGCLGNCDGEDRMLFRGRQRDIASVFLSDLLSERETQADAALAPLTDEGQEDRLADRLGNARAVVGDVDMDLALLFDEVEGDGCWTLSAARSLTGVEQDVVNGAPELLLIDPYGERREFADGDAHVASCRMRANHIHGTLQDHGNRLIFRVQRSAGLREQEQEIEQVGHALDGVLDLLQKFLAFGLRDIAVAHELGVRVHRREIVA